nr:hypothetical protein [Salmonella sp.]
MNSSLKRISLFREIVIIVMGLKFFCHPWNLNVSRLDMELLFAGVLIFMGKFIR